MRAERGLLRTVALGSVLWLLVAATVAAHQNDSRLQIHNVSDRYSMQVFIDGLQFGTLAPKESRAFPVAPGLHYLEVRDDRGRSITRQVEVRDSDSVIDWEVGYAARDAADDGQIQSSADGWLQVVNGASGRTVQVFVDNNPIGVVGPGAAGSFLLTSGVHQVMVCDDQGRAVTGQVQISRQSTTVWRLPELW
jgi:hypothetical protein